MRHENTDAAFPGPRHRSSSSTVGARRRAQRRFDAVTGLLVVGVLLMGAGWWVSDRDRRDHAVSVLSGAPVLSADGLPLPAPDEREFPTPGFEEAGAPLGTPPPPPAGATSYSFSSTQPGDASAPVTWSPCRPVHVVVDTTDAPEGFAADVNEALRQVSAATGLVIVDDGLTTEAPDIERPAYIPELYGDRWAPVLVRFADESTVPDLGTAVGVASPRIVQDGKDGLAHIVSGVVYLDTELLSMPLLDPVATYKGVLLHELAHVVGLDHVDDPTQLMHPTTSDVLTFREGDLAGLAELGRGQCAPRL